MLKLSVVIPVFNEEDSLLELHRQLAEVASAENYQMQVIFIDDGSRDASWQRICEIAAGDERVEGIRFRRNFGKAAALSAGFRAVTGDLVMTLDADLQDDPAEIPNFVAALDEQDVDVISGWKKVRHDPWHKVLPSRVFNGLVSWMTGVKLHDHNCGMKCYRAEVVREVSLYGEMHRFVPVLAAARGFGAGEIVIQHRARQFGKSKYGLERLVKGFLDLLTVKFLTGFGYRPLHVLGTLGLSCFLLGVFGLTYLAAIWSISRMTDAPDVHLHERAALYYSLGLFLLGGQFMSIGFVGELITSHQRKESDIYAISETTGGAIESTSQANPMDAQ
jgi:dolichol-phosphate mannosyltransferase